MTRSISSTVQKQLFAISKWLCQNPDCREKVIIEWTKAIFNIWEMAHIKWHSSSWPRGDNKNESDNSFENLIVLCPNCHAKIDSNPEDYPEELLKQWKQILSDNYSGIQTIQDAWDEVINSTKKQIKPSLVLNGRKEYITELISVLELDWKKIEVKSDSLLESYLFTFAVLLGSQKNRNIVAKVANNQEEFELLSNSSDKITIIPNKWFIPSNIWRAIANWNNVILFSGKKSLHKSIHFDKSIELLPMNRFDRIDWLKEVLWDEQIAEKVYNETKGYLFPILRHKALEFNESLRPEWLDKTDKKVLTTIFLISEWEEGTDEELIKYLSDREYIEFKEDLEVLAKSDDSPIRKISNVWQIISKSDLWVFVQDEITESVLKNFKTVCTYALSDLDPRVDLPVKDRWWANIITNKRPEFSSRSKRWLSDSLVLLSIIDNDNVKNIIWQIVNDILKSEKNISKLLNSIDSNIENIAEACPSIFLYFIDNNIDDLQWVFEWWDLVMWGWWSYCQLLWALERLSWNKEYIYKVIDILCKLVQRYDSQIADNNVNRPLWTLKEIFVLWKNNTILSVGERLKVLEKLSNKYEKLVFDLLVKLFNQTNSFWVAKPNYQLWSKDVKNNITHWEHNIYIKGIILLMIELFEKNIEERVEDIVNNFTKFPKKEFNKVISILEWINFSSFQNKEILLKVVSEIEEKLHFFKIYQHESILTHYNEAESKLIKLHWLLLSGNELISNIGLFDEDRKIIVSRLSEYKWEKGHWDEERKIADREREKKIKDIYKKYRFEWIIKLVKELKYNHLIVSAIIESWLKKKIQEDIFLLLAHKNKKLVYFAMNFIYQLDYKWDEFINKKIKILNNFEQKLKINFLSWLKLRTSTLKLIKKQSLEEQKLFWEWLWQLNNYYFLDEDGYDEINYFLWELNKYGFTHIAFNEIGMLEHKKQMDNIDNKLILEILDNLVDFINNKRWHVHSLKYTFENILSYLYWQIDKWFLPKKAILQIEYRYVKILDEPKILNEELSSNPDFYVEMICNICKTKHRNKEEVIKDKKAVASVSYEVLRKFTMIPWYRNGKINYKELESWIDRVLRLLEEKDRYEIWCQKVWELLINCWEGKDWIWPVEEVRYILEKYENDEIETWFCIWKSNSRGVTTRRIYDWWKKEKTLAEWFYRDAEKIRLDYPRTSWVLRNLWDNYTRDAKWEDDRVKLE